MLINDFYYTDKNKIEELYLDKFVDSNENTTTLTNCILNITEDKEDNLLTTTELDNIINKLPNNKSPGIDNIPYEIIKLIY